MSSPFLGYPVFSWPAAPFGLLYTFAAGSSTPKSTYSDKDNLIPNINPVQLDATGTAIVRLGTGSYKFVLLDQTNTTTLWTADYYTTALYTLSDVVGALGADPIIRRTTAEITAGSAVTAAQYPPGHVWRYGADPLGAADSTTPIQVAINAAGQGGYSVYLPTGTYKITADITVPVGTLPLQGGNGPFAINIYGDGREQTLIQFSGNAFVNGFYFNGGGAAKLCGSVRDIRFDGGQTALTGMTFAWCDMPRLQRVWVRNFTGSGFTMNNSILPVLDTVYATGNGSATAAQIEIDTSTTLGWRNCYISGSNAGCIAGLRIDRSSQSQIDGGAIESTGIPIQISCKVSTTIGCTGVTIRNIDLENPGNGNRYIDVGSAVTGGNFVEDVVLDGWTGFPSGTTTQPSGVRFQNTLGAECRMAQFTVAGTPAATYELGGTNNTGIVIRTHRNMYGSTYPWVISNSTQIKAAGPSYDWSLGDSPRGLVSVPNNISGANPSILISATQGGYYSVCGVTNGGATNMATLTGGESGMQITLIANDANTTLVQGTGASQFSLLTGANTALGATKSYSFVHNGTCWIQH